MPALNIRYSLTAAMATLLAGNAMAENIPLSGVTPLNLSGNYVNPIELSGTVEAQGLQDGSWVRASGIFQAGLTNNASISLSSASPNQPSGNGSLYIQGAPMSGNPATLQGDFVNTGKLLAANLDDANVYVGDALITGQFKNQGTISLGNTLGAPATNLLIERATLSNGFENTGTISSTGDGTENLSITNSVIGYFNNKGTLSAEGARSVAFHFGTGNTITYTPSPAPGDDPMAPSQPTYYNSGTISAKGVGSIAAKLNDGHFENSGEIRADGTAVDLTGGGRLTQTTGLIEGGETALQGNFGLDPAPSFGSHAVFEGGTVRGDIRNMWVTDVYGNVSMDSALIQTRYFELGEGRLTLLRPHTQLDGNLELIGSELELTLSHATDQNRPVLNVTGEAEADSGSRILLTPKPNDFSTQGEQKYQLISASRWYRYDEDNQAIALTAGDLSVTSTSALLSVNSHSFDGNTLVANLEAVTGEKAAEVVAEAGASPDAQGAISEFSDELDHLSPTDPLFEDIANADAGQTAKLAEQLYPDVNGGANTLAITQQKSMENAVQQRGTALRGQPDNLGKGGVWVQALNGDGSQGRRQNITGFDMNASGIAVGADATLLPGLIAGAAYGYMDGNVKSHNGNKTDVDGNALTLYGSYQAGSFFVDSDLTYGWSDNHNKRYISNTRAKGNYHGNLAGVGLMTGYTFHLDRGVILEPRAGARYSNVQLDGYDESGSSAALHVGSQRYERGELGAGLRLSGNLPAGNGRLIPDASLMAWHDLIGDRVSTTSSFLIGGGSFETTGVRQSRDSYEAKLGLDYRLDAVSLGAGYRYEGSSDFNAHGVEARLRYDF
jgi:outer membrane autotransporter protein